MKNLHPFLAAGLAIGLLPTIASADERRFTYVYEPEVLPKGAMEFEQWITLRTQRTGGGAVQQGNFNRWELREELEYGVTDRYSVSLYLNAKSTSFKDYASSPPASASEFKFAGVSLENRYMLVNPVNHLVGITLYFEPTFSGDAVELEQKIIIGQRHGDWKWALNLGHAVEWEHDLHDVEGELEASFGIARDFARNWSVGLELRSHNVLADHRRWENGALFVGPAVNYRREKWWATLSVMPQVYGYNFDGDPDNNRRLELSDHERLNVRLIFGISF